MWQRTIRFKKLELLGEGGQGRVYKALRQDAQAKLRQIVALKILHSKTAVDLWRQEFESLSRVRSPYCVQVLSFERIARRPALVLEYVAGVSLAQLGQTCWLDREDLDELCAQLECALKDLHQQGIFHGDLSPQNVLLDQDGRVRVLDFGLANCSEVSLRVTPQFASPERLMGAPVTVATDLFSLGRVMEFLGIPLHSARTYLHTQPEQRSFQDLRPCSKRQRSLAKKVLELIERRKRGADLKTQTQAGQRPKTWSCKGFLVGTITSVLFLTASSASQGNSPARLAVLRLRTEKWHYFLLNDRPVGYSPLSIPLESEKPYKLKWISADGRGTRDIALKAFETRTLEDRDFSH
jgi:serine/threonine protein kinase